MSVLPSIAAALSPASIRRNASSNGAEAQNARVHARRGPTVSVLAPTTAWPLHRLQSAAIAARSSVSSMLKIAPAGGATSAWPGGCCVTSVQVPPIRSGVSAAPSRPEGPVGPEQAPKAAAV